MIESQNTPVDLRPWETAQSLAALATTIEEGEYARQAEHLADHEVDQAFASALRQAVAEHHSLTGQALALSRKVAEFQQTVEEDQRYVQSLTPDSGLTALSVKKASPVTTPNDLDIAKAQLGLDSDELADAQQELAHAVGDERASIQHELAVHEATMLKYDAELGHENEIADNSVQRHGTLATRLNAWVDQNDRSQPD